MATALGDAFLGRRRNRQLPEDENNAESEHLPNFVRCPETAKLVAVGVHCGTENGKQVITLRVRWLDKSAEAQELWNHINNSITHHANTSPSLHGMLICDGPCHGIVDYTKMMEYPDCGHKICKSCQYNEMSVPNADGSPGCCVPMCVRQTLINRVPYEKYRREAEAKGTPFIGVVQSSASIVPETCSADTSGRTAPTELLQVRILILEKLQSRVVRQKMELEMPSDYPIGCILRVLQERIGSVEGIKTYYTSVSPIRGKQDLNEITIEPGDRKPLSILSGGRGMLNIVVAKPGVHVFKNG
nr:Protein T28C6.5 [Haemonchus contortus]